MGITDRTRKILWGRSGNRCAICKRELVHPGTHATDDSVIGEECHIYSDKPDGPRFEPALIPTRDRPEHLLLLCAVDHKIVGDQPACYNADMLRRIKAAHEAWVASTLSDRRGGTIDETREAGAGVIALPRVETGASLLRLFDGAHLYFLDNPEPRDGRAAELISSFVDLCHDYGDALSIVSPGDRVRIGFELTAEIQALEASGFLVFCDRRRERHCYWGLDDFWEGGCSTCHRAR